MNQTRTIDIHHVTRVEGHGDIKIRIRDGNLEEARWEVVETPRFFEAMLVGKKWENAPWISSRICGICSISHALASIRAVENAFRIVPSEQTRKLRLLLKHMETLQSHILHLYFLAAPDFLKTGSVFPLINAHPEVVQRAARLKLLANDLCDCVGGRPFVSRRTDRAGGNSHQRLAALLRGNRSDQARVIPGAEEHSQWDIAFQAAANPLPQQRLHLVEGMDLETSRLRGPRFARRQQRTGPGGRGRWPALYASGPVQQG